jgi:hypothetical protein
MAVLFLHVNVSVSSLPVHAGGGVCRGVPELHCGVVSGRRQLRRGAGVYATSVFLPCCIVVDVVVDVNRDVNCDVMTANHRCGVIIAIGVLAVGGGVLQVACVHRQRDVLRAASSCHHRGVQW